MIDLFLRIVFCNLVSGPSDANGSDGTNKLFYTTWRAFAKQNFSSQYFGPEADFIKAIQKAINHPSFDVNDQNHHYGLVSAGEKQTPLIFSLQQG